MKVLGRRLVYPAHPWLTSWLEEEWLYPSSDAFDSDWIVNLVVHDLEVPPEIVAADYVLGQYETRHVVTAPSQFWIIEDQSATCVTIGTQDAMVELYGTPFEGWRALHGSISESLSASGLIRFHAASVSKEDRTMAFLGPSGRGKSTTLITSLQFGWRPVAEDACWLEPESLRMFGMDRHLRLLPDAVERVRGFMPDLEVGTPVDGKYPVSYESLGGRVDDRVFTDIAVLRRDPSVETHWQPLDGASSVMALYEACGVPHTDSQRQLLGKRLGAVVQRIQSRQLVLGKTPLEL